MKVKILIWRIIIQHGRGFFKLKAIEVPVRTIVDRGASRIKIVDLFFLPFQFLKIHLHYSKKRLQKNAS